MCLKPCHYSFTKKKFFQHTCYLKGGNFFLFFFCTNWHHLDLKCFSKWTINFFLFDVFFLDEFIWNLLVVQERKYFLPGISDRWVFFTAEHIFSFQTWWLAAFLFYGGMGALGVTDEESFKGSHGPVRNLLDSNRSKVFEHQWRSFEDAQKGEPQH